MTDAFDSYEGQTHAMPRCEPRCDLATLPDRDLIRGHCSRCSHVIDGKAASRILRARALVEEADGGG